MVSRLSAGRSIIVAALLPFIAIILYQAEDSIWYAPRMFNHLIPYPILEFCLSRDRGEDFRLLA
jgi:cytochrome c oxidase assembly factor CtaG